MQARLQKRGETVGRLANDKKWQQNMNKSYKTASARHMTFPKEREREKRKGRQLKARAYVISKKNIKRERKKQHECFPTKDEKQLL